VFCVNNVICLPGGRPEGVFRAVTTRDAAAMARDGEPYYDARLIRDEDRDGPLYEIQFADGVWMLASLRDLDIG
jgi:hypothetical protein